MNTSSVKGHIFISKLSVTRVSAYLRKYWFIYMLVAPGLILLIVFHYLPIYGILIAFKDYKFTKGILGSPWVGFKNFEEILLEYDFLMVVKNTVIINIYNIFFGTSFTIMLALFLNEIRSSFIKRVSQTLVYLPGFISWVIMAGLVSQFLSPTDGAINKLIQALGGEPIYFLMMPQYFRGILVVSGILKSAGYGTIYYLAAIAGVNPELYESAVIDGAHRGHLMWYITIPRIKPIIAVLLILSMAGLFSSNFEQVFNLLNPTVYDTGDVISTYLYRTTFQNPRYEAGAAIGIVFQVFGLMSLLLSNYVVKKFNVTGIL